jgi:flagellar hook-length control protein FliK
MIVSAPSPTTATPSVEAGADPADGSSFSALIDTNTPATSTTTAATTETAMPSVVAPPAPKVAPFNLAMAQPVPPGALDANGKAPPVPTTQAETGEVVATPVATLVPPAGAAKPVATEAPEEPAKTSPALAEGGPAVPLPAPAQGARPAVVAEKPVEEKAADKAKASKAERLADADAPQPDPQAQPAAVAQPVQAAATPVVQAMSAGATVQPDQSENVAAGQDSALATRQVTRAKGGAVAAAEPQSGPQSHALAARNAVAEVGAAPTPAANEADNSLSSPLLTQTMALVTSRPAASPYPAIDQTAAQSPIVQAQPGRLGADIGVEIAKAAKGDRDDLLIRLDPREMGRIDVRLSFDRDGTLRAVMSADSPAALDMLRRESGDLNRALVDAGIRSDGQSLRFDARSGEQGQGGGQGWQRGQQNQNGGSSLADDNTADFTDPHYRPLRASGQVDLMA